MKHFYTIITALKCFTIIALLYSDSFSQTGWVSQSSGTSGHLRSVYFINDMTGWTAGFSGTILKTTNGGANWTALTSGTSNTLLSIFFINSLSGWVSGGLGEIYATGNGGVTWALQTTGITTALNSIQFISPSTGWAVGEFMTILKTTNSGTNWTPIFSGSVPLNSVYFISTTVGYIAGNSGYVMKSTNGGINWTVNNSTVDYNLYSIHFPTGSTTTGYAVGMGSPSPPIIKSTDTGLNWSIQPVPLGNALTSVFFTSVSTGWAVGWIGTIMRTSNAGVNWSDQSSGTPQSLRSVFFANSLTGWAVGDVGTILKTTSGGITGIKAISNNIPEIFILYQNYPNPFNPKTIINYQLPITNFVKLAVYDVSGKEVITLVNEQLKPGNYKVEFDASSLTSGVYFYKLLAEDFTETRKMILLK